MWPRPKTVDTTTFEYDKWCFGNIVLYTLVTSKEYWGYWLHPWYLNYIRLKSPQQHPFFLFKEPLYDLAFLAALWSSCFHNITWFPNDSTLWESPKLLSFLRASAIARSESMDDIWPPPSPPELYQINVHRSNIKARKTGKKLLRPLSSNMKSEINLPLRNRTFLSQYSTKDVNKGQEDTGT